MANEQTQGEHDHVEMENTTKEVIQNVSLWWSCGETTKVDMTFFVCFLGLMCFIK